MSLSSGSTPSAGGDVPESGCRLLRERRAREAAELLVSERTRELYVQLEDARELASLLDEHLTLLSTVCDLHEIGTATGVLGYRLDTGAAWTTSGCEALLGPTSTRAGFLSLLPREIAVRIEAFEAHARPGAEGDVLKLTYVTEGDAPEKRSMELSAAIVEAGGVRQFVSVHRIAQESEAVAAR